MKALLRLAIIGLTAGGELTACSTTAATQNLADEFPFRTKTQYFNFHYKRSSSQVTRVSRFSDGFIRLVNRDFFTADFDYPIRVFILEDSIRFEEFVHRELHRPGPAGYGIYLYRDKLLATYEDSGLGTYTHELLHPLLEKQLKTVPAWAFEGVPTFFEKFYGFWRGNDLVLFWGFQNPWRIKALGPNLTRLNLKEILSGRETNESKLRMVSVFLWKQGRLRRFLKLMSTNDKREYDSYFEAAMEMPLDRILPLWQNYLNDVARQRAAISSLPPSTVFDSEEAFQNFAKSHGIATEQVKQRD